MYSCLSVWMSLMPAYAKVYHSSVSEATCGTWDYDLCRNETDCPGLSGPWSCDPKAWAEWATWPWPYCSY